MCKLSVLLHQALALTFLEYLNAQSTVWLPIRTYRVLFVASQEPEQQKPEPEHKTTAKTCKLL